VKLKNWRLEIRNPKQIQNSTAESWKGRTGISNFFLEKKSPFVLTFLERKALLDHHLEADRMCQLWNRHIRSVFFLRARATLPGRGCSICRSLSNSWIDQLFQPLHFSPIAMCAYGQFIAMVAKTA